MDFGRCHGADVTEALRDDEVGVQPAQHRLVDPIEPFAVPQSLPDLSVDVRAAGLLGVHNAADDDRLRSDFRWIVAFMADGHEIVREAERGHDLRRSWKQGTDAHGQLQNRLARDSRS
jgi:hypothetical protein